MNELAHRSRSDVEDERRSQSAENRLSHDPSFEIEGKGASGRTVLYASANPSFQQPVSLANLVLTWRIQRRLRYLQSVYAHNEEQETHLNSILTEWTNPVQHSIVSYSSDKTNESGRLVSQAGQICGVEKSALAHSTVFEPSAEALDIQSIGYVPQKISVNRKSVNALSVRGE